MTDEQHEHDEEPDESAEPDGDQDPDVRQENDEEEPAQPRRLTIGELAEEFQKTTGRPAPGIATPGIFTATEALRRAFDSPFQRMLREGPAAQLFGNPGLSARLQGLFPAQENAISAAVRASLQSQSVFSNLDLRHLMPGGVLSRNEALRLAGSTLWERLQELDPENWRGERLRRLDMLKVMEEGIPLVWTPPADVIRDLLDAPDAPARRKVLEQQAAAVVEHCRTVLTDVHRHDLTAEVGFLNDCLDSIDGGKDAAAQVLASSVLDTVLRAMVRADASLQNGQGGFNFKVLAAQLPKATPDTLVGQFRAYCINTSIHRAYEPYFGPPVPEEFNRHATAHAAGPTQITLANALAAMMLAVGLLRELEETQRPLSPAG
ncbi:hypothetical protein ABZ732_08795 [Streptomyces pseudogriseolus]|uniref:hypothetical protein n=1 Tax=Streptomyces pseudogriseolus TaxID=36817 RepID=UPI003492127A